MRKLCMLYCLLAFFHGEIFAQQTERWIVFVVENASIDAFGGTQIKEVFPNQNLEVWEITPEEKQKILSQGDHKLRLVELDHRYQASMLPDDPMLAKQWFYQNEEQSGGKYGADIQATKGWEIERGNKGVVVGVIDSGIDWNHPDLIHNIWQNLAEDADGDGTVLEWNGSRWVFDPDDENGIDEDGNGYIDDFIGWDFVNQDNDPSDDHSMGHGTHVAGLIGAEGNNGIGGSGVAWEVQLMGLKILNAKGSGFTSDAVAALDYAVKMGAQISNNSWGGGLWSSLLDHSLTLALQAGHTYVAAAGNNFMNDNDAIPLYPASYPHDNIISVSATDHWDLPAKFGNKGLNSVDLFAPGDGILSTLPEGKYGFSSGTSMAAPLVSGALALLLSKEPGMNPIDVKEKLLRSVDRLPELEVLCKSGGRLNIYRLLSTACDAVAYFPFDKSNLCQKDTIRMQNFSSNAVSQSWYLDGRWVSNEFAPEIVLPKANDDPREISLIAQGTSCSDTFTVSILLEKNADIPDMDTVHCGPFIWLTSPIKSPLYTYYWYDEEDRLMSISEGVKITEEGEYKLKIEDECGGSSDRKFDVELIQGCMWPGDANADGEVNMTDYLLTGLANGRFGPARLDRSTDFSPHNAFPWLGSFPAHNLLGNRANYMHADADGNGFISLASDAEVIKQNFSKQIFPVQEAQGVADVSLAMETGGTVLGDTTPFSLNLENIAPELAADIVGISVRLEYDMPLSTPIEINFKNTWFWEEGKSHSMVVRDEKKRQIHIGMYRTGGLLNFTEGAFLRGGIIVVVDDIGIYGTNAAQAFLSISVTGINIVRSDGTILPINQMSSISNIATESLMIEIPEDSRGLGLLNRNEVNLYPNPVQESLHVELLEAANSFVEVEMYGADSRRIWKQKIEIDYPQKNFQFSLPKVPMGYYWIKVRDEKNQFLKVVIVNR